jgi:hypothetical protein
MHSAIKALTLSAVTLGIWLLSSACFASSGDVTHQKLAFLAGGSGEGSEDSNGEGGRNFFVKDLETLRARLKDRGWSVRAAVGSKDGLLPGARRATNKNITEGALAVIVAAKSGDEVMLLFHSHGHERDTDWGQTSHSITSEDEDGSGNDLGFDLDTLEPALLKARESGVRTALVDLSCYSGTSQTLKGPACTVTLAAPNYISLCSGRPEERHFTSAFIDLPAKTSAMDLESWFFRSRAADRDSINLPLISSRPSPALEGWEAFLESVDPLDVYEDLQKIRTGAKPFDPARLLGPVSTLGSVELRARISARLKEVLSVRKELEDAMPALAHEYDDRNLAIETAGRQPFSLAPGFLAEILNRFHDPSFSLKKPASLEGYDQAQRNAFTALYSVREKVASRYAEPLREFTRERNAFNALIDRLAAQAGSLFALERELYDEARPKSESNACHDFSL